MRCTTYDMNSRHVYDGIGIERKPFPHVQIGERRSIFSQGQGLMRVHVDRSLATAGNEMIDDVVFEIKRYKGRFERFLMAAKGNQDVWKRRMVLLRAASGFELDSPDLRQAIVLAAGIRGRGPARIHEYLVILEAGAVIKLTATKSGARWNLEFEDSGDRLRGYEDV